jgi:hypothetical protein
MGRCRRATCPKCLTQIASPLYPTGMHGLHLGITHILFIARIYSTNSQKGEKA